MLVSQYLSLGNDNKVAKTKADESKHAAVDKGGMTKINEGVIKSGKSKISSDLKRHKSLSAKRSSHSSLGRIRSLLNMQLKMRKEKKIEKPSERLEESIVEKDNSEKEPGEELVKEKGVSSKNMSSTPKVDRIECLVLDKTQPDVTIKEDEMKSTDRVEQRPPCNLAPSPCEDQTQLDDLAPVKVDDLKILEVKVKQRIRLYAKISFCSAFIVFSITFVILIITIFGWWILLSAHELLSYERAVRSVSGWTNGRSDLLVKPAASWYYERCRMRNISSLSWTSWTHCFRSKTQAVQWRWRNVSSGLYLVDEQLVNIKWC